MKFLKSLIIPVVVTFLIVAFTSCSKDKEVVSSISKDEFVGKWKASWILGAINQEVQVELKSNAVSEIEVLPVDGNPEFFGTWDLTGNNFFSHFTYSGNPDFIKFEATSTTSTVISGKLTFGGQIGTFAMTKK